MMLERSLIQDHFCKLIVEIQLFSVQFSLTTFSSADICHNFVQVTDWCSTSKIAFLAVCWSVDEKFICTRSTQRRLLEVTLVQVIVAFHDLLNFSKLFRLQAFFHDAHGYMRNKNGIGPGYVYTLTDKKVFRKNMLLGHFSGIVYWIFVNFFNTEDFHKFPFRSLLLC